jgi:anti-anti-sigma factor
MSDGDKTCTIRINGRFDFNIHKEFRKGYQTVNDPQGVSFVIDMGDVDYMDSSALGMLLVLREQAGGDGSNITIKNCKSDIEKILEVSNFKNLFKMT